MWLGTEEEAEEMAVPWSAFTAPSLIEFGSSIPFMATEDASLSWINEAAVRAGLKGVVDIA